jgi:dolichol-phosphate mannosyltransferase
MTQLIAMTRKTLLTPERIRFVKFCTVGASGVAVNLGFFTVFLYLMKSTTIQSESLLFLLANFAGFMISVLTNFLLNDFWTWGDREKRGHAHFFGRLLKFYVVSSLGGTVQLGMAYACHVALGMNEYLAVLVGIGAATIINFVANNLWTFKDTGKA